MATPLFKFRLSDDERMSWQEQADLCDLTLSEWIRLHCNAAVSRSVVPAPVKPALPPKPSVVPPASSKRNYTGATALMFHKKQYEYLLEDGTPRWTTEAP